MKSLLKYIPLFLFIFIQQCSTQGIELHGTIYGSDGKPVKFAYLRIAKADDGNLGAGDYHCSSPIQKSIVRQNGNFSFHLENPGNYRLIITPVNDEIIVIPLLLPQIKDEITFDIHLAPIGYLDSLNELKILGNWNNFNYNTAEEMTKQSDGSFVFEKDLPSDTLSYLLAVNAYIPTPRPKEINCSTNADNYKVDKYGNIISRVVSKNKHFKIIFEPQKLKHITNEFLPKVELDSRHKNLSKIINLYLKWDQMRLDISKVFWKKEVENNEFYNYKNDLLKIHNELEQIFLNNPDEPLIVQQSAIIFRLLPMIGHSDTKVDSSLIPNILKFLPPSSLLWEFDPQCVLALISKKETNKSEELLRKFEEQNPNRKVRATALASLTHIAWFRNEKDKERVLYNELKSKYGDVKEIAFELQTAKPDTDSSLTAGHLLPKFSFKLLNKDKIITNVDLKGNYFLIDFWSTWCGGCVATIPYIDKAFQKYRNRNFKILSVSFDNTPGIVNKFRTERYSMPWINAILNKSDNAKACKDFNIIGLPKAFLVNPQGKIVATPSELMGENIIHTLDKILGK